MSLVKALDKSNYKLILVGAVSDNQKSYFNEIKEIMDRNPNFYYIPKIENSKLYQLYKVCKVSTLPSWLDTPGLVSLEAAAMGCNLAISSKGSTTEYFINMAEYCLPDDINGIRSAIDRAYAKPQNDKLKNRIFENYTWEIAGQKTLEAYKTILDEGELLYEKIMLVFGTRPEAIKMCPLVNELKRREDFETVVCVTGQHRQMLDQVLETFEVIPDYDLSIMKDKQTLFDITTNILNKIKSVLEKEQPDVVLVHGDTSTTFVTALACYYFQIPVGHVEAGLRTYNIYSPYPEEFNRQAVSIISQYNFAPTEKSKENLIKEGRDASRIWVTGNTVIDALKTTVREDYSHPELNGQKEVA